MSARSVVSFAALMLLADVRLSLFAYALAAAYALYEAVRLKRIRRIGRFVPGGVLAVLLTLSITVPLLGGNLAEDSIVSDPVFSRMIRSGLCGIRERHPGRKPRGA